MARIVSVTFDTKSHTEGGRFSIPQPALKVLDLRAGDPVEVRVLWEGHQLQVATRIRDGLNVAFEPSDPEAKRLKDIPPRTPILVTVWNAGETRVPDGGAPSREWDDERFNAEHEKSARSSDALVDLREWADRNGVHTRYGRGTTGPLHFFVDERPATVGLFSFNTRGNLEFVLRDNLANVVAFESHASRAEFVRRMADAAGVEKAESLADTWFGFAGSIFADRSRRARVLDVLDWLLGQVRAASR